MMALGVICLMSVQETIISMLIDMCTLTVWGVRQNNMDLRFQSMSQDKKTVSQDGTNRGFLLLNLLFAIELQPILMETCVPKDTNCLKEDTSEHVGAIRAAMK